GVMLHGCTIGNECLIGMGTIVLDRVVIEDRVMIGAGSLVPPNRRLESGWLYMGRPAEKKRLLTEAELTNFNYSAAHYVRLMAKYRDAI
ncbi:MAG: gamma carbonic anhydrase family protein, partial [Burkholderiales bacterium]|nr:gamma carbonic anhydrase family protein [Burkholderiales bacterium]